MNYKTAIKLLENGKGYTVKDYFKNNGYNLEYGYINLLEGNFEEAKKTFEILTSTRAEWALLLIPLIKGESYELPSYFQIRNFLEIDISLFLKYKKTKYVQQLLKIADFLQDINNETYKFIARVMLKHNFMEISKIFLDKAVSYYYNDVELHYLYVEFYLAHSDKTNALKAVNTCLRINPTYYPAKKTHSELTTKKSQLS